MISMEKKKIWIEHKLGFKKEKRTDSISFEEAFRLLSLTHKNLSWIPVRKP